MNRLERNYLSVEELVTHFTNGACSYLSKRELQLERNYLSVEGLVTHFTNGACSYLSKRELQ